MEPGGSAAPLTPAARGRKIPGTMTWGNARTSYAYRAWSVPTPPLGIA